MRKILNVVLPFAVFKRLSILYSVLWTLLDSPSAAKAMILGKGERRHSFRRLLHPFTYRLIEPDRGVVMQNIVRGECVGGPMPAHADFIVDGGGYIGDSAAVFLSQYPTATCLVFEPSSNCELAARNLAPYGARACLVRAILARAGGAFSLVECGTGSKAIPSVSTQAEFEVWTMEDALQKSPTGVIDLLKLDIEGGELDILRPPTPWLAAVRCLIIELHGDAANHDIPGWLREEGFEIKRHRSLLFCNRTGK